MKFLVVRAWYYDDPRIQAVMGMVDKLWELLEVPPLTKVVTRHLSTIWKGLPFQKRGFYYARYWAAWEEWKICPARFLVIVDADVIPTNRKALVNLCNFLDQIPAHIGIVTRETIGRVENTLRQRFVIFNNVGFMPSEGISAWQGKYIPALLMHKMYQYPWVAYPLLKSKYEISMSEGIYTCGLPPIPMVTFPKEILILTGTGAAVPPEVIDSTNFIHPSGYVGNLGYAQTVFSVFQRSIEGRF